MAFNKSKESSHGPEGAERVFRKYFVVELHLIPMRMTVSRDAAKLSNLRSLMLHEFNERYPEAAEHILMLPIMKGV